MKVKELIDIIQDFPEATVLIAMEDVFTDDVWVSDMSDESIMIEEK